MITSVPINLVPIAVCLYYFYRKRPKEIEAFAGDQAGPLTNYKMLVRSFLQLPNARVSKIHEEHILLAIDNTATGGKLCIRDELDSVSITWNAGIPLGGKRDKTWVFPNTTSQDVIMATIKRYIEARMQEMYN